MKYSTLGWHRAVLISRGQAGFTLLELAIVVAVIGILAAIAAPSFLGLLDTHRVTINEQKVHQAIRMAQQDAIQARSDWQFSLREMGDRWEWASHPKSLAPSQVSAWESLDTGVILDLANTTLAVNSNVYYVRFDYLGNISYRLGRATFASRNGGPTKRCLIVSTLIGAMRDGREQKVPDSSGKYCY